MCTNCTYVSIMHIQGIITTVTLYEHTNINVASSPGPLCGEGGLHETTIIVVNVHGSMVRFFKFRSVIFHM